MLVGTEGPGVAFGILEPKDFFSERHATIFRVMKDVFEQGEPVNLVTVGEEVRKRDLYEAIGGATYLGIELPDSVATDASTEFYCLKVRDHSIRRQVIARMQNAQDALWKSNDEAWLSELDKITELSSLPLSKGRRFPSIQSAPDLLTEIIPPPNWIVRQLIAEGLIVLAGKAKLGKSYMALGIALAVASGGYALGRIEVERGEVLYISPDDKNKRRHQDRIRKLLNGEPVPQDFYLALDWPRFGDGGGERHLDKWLTDHPNARLVVLDTFGKVRKRGRANGNAYDEDSDAMDYFKALADKHHIAVLLIHHCRKALSDSGDVMDEILGSMGVTGGVDTAMVLKRGRGEADAVLHLIGRDIEDEEPLALDFDRSNCFWTLKGKASEYLLSKERREILDAIQEAGTPLSPKEVADVTGKTRAACQMTMTRLASEGLLKQCGYGKYNVVKECYSSDSVTLAAVPDEYRRESNPQAGPRVTPDEPRVTGDDGGCYSSCYSSNPISEGHLGVKSSDFRKNGARVTRVTPLTENETKVFEVEFEEGEL
jgi:hypothetical protein